MSEEHEALELPADWQPEEYPVALGDCIDLAYNLREERLEKEKEVKALKLRELALRNHLFNLLEAGGLEGAKGAVATASRSDELKPQVTDWDAFYAYVHENNAFELLERRVARVAYRERFEAGVLIPGTEAYLYPKLSLTKSSRNKKEE